MGQQWERELRSVLSGDPEGVRVVTRSCSAVERSMALRVIERPFLVIRAAGSGAAGVGDILAIRGDLSFPIEVKSSKNELIYLSGRTKEQLDAMLSHADRCGIVGLYAFRLKGVRGDSWRMFRIDSNSFTGRLRTLARRIPVLPLTGRGNPYLDWNKGMPLHQFIGLVCADRTL